MLAVATLLVIGGTLVTFGGCIWLSDAAPLDNRPGPVLICGLVMFIGGSLLGVSCEIRERLDRLVSKLVGDEPSEEPPPQAKTSEPIVCPRCRKQTTANKKKCPRCGWLLAPSLDGSLADFE